VCRRMWSVSLLLVVVLVVVVRKVSSNSCSSDRLVVYQLRLDTGWGEETFPKQYPQWRPPAQWSRTVGYSHGTGMSLFSIGSVAGQGVKQFVETGDSDLLDKEATNRTFLDTFSAPPISSGIGNTTTRVFVDGNHTKVSLVTKLVPSPDWFVGLDSLELCQDGKFIDNIRLEADPLDAGTDNGFTFTSPNWPTEPQGTVFQITSQYPSHPAGSFNYPHLAKLPTIAYFTLTKEKEYELSSSYEEKPNDIFKYDTFDHSENGIGIEFIPLQESNIEEIETQPEKLPVPAMQKKKKKTDKGTLLSGNKRNMAGLRSDNKGYYASSGPEDFIKKKYRSTKLSKVNQLVFPGSLGSLNQNLLFDKILTSYPTLPTSRRKRFRSKKHYRKIKKRKPQDCRVTKWGDWGPCSKSCGIGETLRTRTVKKHSKHGGKPCPPLREVKWCGSARNCNSGYFDW